MKHILRFRLGIVLGLMGAMSNSAVAAEFAVPHKFTAGTPARAAEVNANFTAVESAVNSEESRLRTLETNAAKPDLAPGGNLVLSVSTPTAGNIIKDSHPFLHSYGNGNTFLGSDAGNFTQSGENNTGIGNRALAQNTEGESNVALGLGALYWNSSGSYNSATGALALSRNLTGEGNTAIGYAALGINATGNSNTAVGTQALENSVAISGNSAVGTRALQSLTAGENNVAVGFSALSSLATGEENTAIGPQAGLLLHSGDRNVYIANSGGRQESSTLRIGEGQTRAFITGIRGVTTANLNAIPVVIDSQGQLGTVSSSRRFKEDIADMGDASSLLMQLRPVTFHYRSDQNPNGRALQYGLVAEEVAEVAPGLVAHSNDGEIETVFYEFLTPMLLNEVQKQQRTIDAQDKRLAQLEREVAALRKRSAN